MDITYTIPDAVVKGLRNEPTSPLFQPEAPAASAPIEPVAPVAAEEPVKEAPVEEKAPEAATAPEPQVETPAQEKKEEAPAPAAPAEPAQELEDINLEDDEALSKILPKIEKPKVKAVSQSGNEIELGEDELEKLAIQSFNKKFKVEASGFDEVFEVLKANVDRNKELESKLKKYEESNSSILVEDPLVQEIANMRRAGASADDVAAAINVLKVDYLQKDQGGKYLVDDGQILKEYYAKNYSDLNEEQIELEIESMTPLVKAKEANLARKELAAERETKFSKWKSIAKQLDAKRQVEEPIDTDKLIAEQHQKFLEVFSNNAKGIKAINEIGVGESVRSFVYSLVEADPLFLTSLFYDQDGNQKTDALVEAVLRFHPQVPASIKNRLFFNSKVDLKAEQQKWEAQFMRQRVNLSDPVPDTAGNQGAPQKRDPREIAREVAAGTLKLDRGSYTKK